jgi:uncharacterized protein YecE (DUF72 family)
VANGTIRLGIAGWLLEPWRAGAFYPVGLKQKEELHYASRHLGVIEINATFRSLQKPASFRKWAAETPEDFVFSIKGHQNITHFKRLKDVDIAVASFMASGPLALGSRLGPFVWQLPPNLKYERDKFEAFFALLPKTPEEAVALAGRHDGIKDPYLSAEGVGAIRHAVEVRNESFAIPEFIDLCRAHNVALVTADTAEWPVMDATADFTYARLQGAPGSDHYELAGLDLWARRIDAQASGKPVPEAKLVTRAVDTPRDVFALFVSTDKEHAPQNAHNVMKRLGLTPST